MTMSRADQARWRYGHVMTPMQKKLFWTLMGGDNGPPGSDVFWDEAYYLLEAIYPQGRKPEDRLDPTHRTKPFGLHVSSLFARKKGILLRYIVPDHKMARLDSTLFEKRLK